MRFVLLTAASLLALSIASCSDPSNTSPDKTVNLDLPKVTMSEIDNLLLKEWTGPYGGIPAFDKMSLDNVETAIDWGMKKNLIEIDAIVANSDTPNFENTILALEKTGQDLDRVFPFWGIWSSNMNSPEFRKIQGKVNPKLSDFSSKIRQNQKLFDRVKAVYDDPAVKNMRPDQQRLIQLTYDGFARNGATLDTAGKARYAEINKRLSKLHTDFANNCLLYTSPSPRDATLSRMPSSA